jgi:hypothetical protein
MIHKQSIAPNRNSYKQANDHAYIMLTPVVSRKSASNTPRLVSKQVIVYVCTSNDVEPIVRILVVPVEEAA